MTEEVSGGGNTTTVVIVVVVVVVLLIALGVGAVIFLKKRKVVSKYLGVLENFDIISGVLISIHRLFYRRPWGMMCSCKYLHSD